MWVYTHNLSYVGDIARRIADQTILGERNVRPYVKNNESKNGWEYGSSGRAAA
jgi:hypothetical protein